MFKLKKIIFVFIFYLFFVSCSYYSNNTKEASDEFLKRYGIYIPKEDIVKVYKFPKFQIGDFYDVEYRLKNNVFGNDYGELDDTIFINYIGKKVINNQNIGNNIKMIENDIYSKIYELNEKYIKKSDKLEKVEIEHGISLFWVKDRINYNQRGTVRRWYLGKWRDIYYDEIYSISNMSKYELSLYKEFKEFADKDYKEIDYLDYFRKTGANIEVSIGVEVRFSGYEYKEYNEYYKELYEYILANHKKLEKYFDSSLISVEIQLFLYEYWVTLPLDEQEKR